MDILTIGPWVILILGAAMLIGAVILAFVLKPPTGLTPLLVFGILLVGLSVHGLAFLDPYGRWLAKWAQTPSAESYQEAVQKIAKGDLPEEYHGMVTSYMLEHPVRNLQAILDKGIETASNPADKDALVQAKNTLVRSRTTAELAEQGLRSQNRLNLDQLKALDPRTQRYIIATWEQKGVPQDVGVAGSREVQAFMQQHRIPQ
jgi:hypothetical protein